MKFRAERDALLEAIGSAGRAVGNRAHGAIALSGIHMEATGNNLHLAGSDLDLTIEVDVEVSVIDPGVCLVPAKLIAEIVRALEPGAVTFEVKDSEAIISSGRSQFTVRLLPAEEFIRLPQLGDDAVTLDAGSLATALRQVVPAASRDDARPILSGVFLEPGEDGLRLVTTDSYRLALRELKGTTLLAEGQHVLVPSRALGELARLLGSTGTAEARLGADNASFVVGSARVTTRLIEGEFPNYRQLIPSSYPNRLTVGKEAFLDAVKRVKLLAREATPVRLAFGPASLEMTAVTHDVGQAREDVDVKYEGTEMVVAFNPEFLIAGIEACPGDEVVLEILDALKPATLRSVDPEDGFLYLLMPVRVS